MTQTTIRGEQITDDTVYREDLNTDLTGRAVITKSVAGTGMSLSSTGVDAGTGDVTFNIANTGVTAASYGSSTSIPSFAVNAQGQLTTAAGNAVIAPAGTLTGTTLAANVVNSSLTSVGTLTSGALGTGFTIVNVAQGGSGRGSNTAYAVICGGTTSTNPEQSVASVGTTGQVLTSNGAGALPTFQTPFTLFTSTDQTITAGGALTISHGLSAMPQIVQVYLVNQTAELNYSVGDVVLIGVSGQPNNTGVSIVPDGTNLNIRFGSQSSTFPILNKSTGASANTTNANWKARFVAMRFG